MKPRSKPEPLSPAERELAEHVSRGRATVRDVEALGTTWREFVHRMSWAGLDGYEIPIDSAYIGQELKRARGEPSNSWRWKGTPDGSRWLCEPRGSGFGEGALAPDVERDGKAWTWRIWETPREDWYPDPDGSTRLLVLGRSARRSRAMAAAEARAAKIFRARLVAVRDFRAPRRGVTIRETGVPVEALFEALAQGRALAEVVRELAVDLADAQQLLRQAAREAVDRAADVAFLPGFPAAP